MNSFLKTDPKLPSMRRIRQRYEIPSQIDVIAEINRQWGQVRKSFDLPKGSAIAVGVGSRGITNLAEVVRAVVMKLRDAGFKPFVTPAMGSHGGATGDGQISVLASLGVSEKSVGVPVKATMEVESLGEVNGIPIFLDKVAHGAAGLVLVNRIKPHTDFAGPTESGIIKMMAIGLGNQIGAEHYHRLSVVRNMYEIISTAGKALMKRTNLLFGVGLVENQDHQTAVLRMMLPGELEAVEIELLKKAANYMPKLPVKEIDLLIIDKMGKDISGAGIDPIVTGRTNCAFMVKRPAPKISRIFVRELSEASDGNAIGIGQADVTTQRLVDKIDAEATAINCLTSCCPEDGKIPFAFQSDREAIAAAVMTLRPHTLDDLRIVHIKSTLELNNLLVSTGCLSYFENKSLVYVEPENIELEFDTSGNLISLL
jgi:hypothetical protein